MVTWKHMLVKGKTVRKNLSLNAFKGVSWIARKATIIQIKQQNWGSIFERKIARFFVFLPGSSSPSHVGKGWQVIDFIVIAWDITLFTIAEGTLGLRRMGVNNTEQASLIPQSIHQTGLASTTHSSLRDQAKSALSTLLPLLCSRAKVAATVPLCSDSNSSTCLFLPGYQSVKQAHSGHQCSRAPSSSTVNQACLLRSLLYAENSCILQEEGETLP